jgi:uncharacterized protein (DUF3084 family)
MKLQELKTAIRAEIKKALKEVEAPYADSFELDQAKGGTDNTYNKIHKQLLKVQTEMNKLFADFKAGKVDKNVYVAKRKQLQAQRTKLENSL